MPVYLRLILRFIVLAVLVVTLALGVAAKQSNTSCPGDCADQRVLCLADCGPIDPGGVCANACWQSYSECVAAC